MAHMFDVWTYKGNLEKSRVLNIIEHLQIPYICMDICRKFGEK
jgi:hypothetical protein